jgi:hypothetical protein
MSDEKSDELNEFLKLVLLVGGGSLVFRCHCSLQKYGVLN